MKYALISDERKGVAFCRNIEPVEDLVIIFKKIITFYHINQYEYKLLFFLCASIHFSHKALSHKAHKKINLIPEKINEFKKCK